MRSRVRHVVPHATNPRYGRVSGISVLFQNPGAACAGTFSWVCQWSDHRWNEIWPGGWDTWSRLVDGKLRMAASLPRNWISKPGLAARLAEVDAARRNACAPYWSVSSCD